MRPPRKLPSRSSASLPGMRRHGLARVLSKLGIASRTQAAEWIRAGRVAVDGQVVRDAECPTDPERARLSIDGIAVGARERLYLMLNKPRGYVTTASDERGRDTVYALLAESGLPWIAPVGRLDKASEGVLLLTNDSEWAARITAPHSAIDKTYHVRIDRLPDAAVLAALVHGVEVDGETLAVKQVGELRRGEKNAWLEIVLDEGRNRQIRRVLGAFDIAVLRLVRVGVGGIELGELAKGCWRHLSAAEVASLAEPSTTVPAFSSC
ncbi:MAG: pseudouridine synthase [Dokdonella sp.]|uniref:pseudouridine synthase n=1 Tax=Dokdonella sp. TaxID=2291710 RepID=UPI003267AEEA